MLRSAVRMTKVVATLGPACDDDATLEAMLDAGMSVVRLNLSHGSHDEHAARLDRVRALAGRRRQPLAIMLDTRGVEVRTTPLRDGAVDIAAGDTFALHVDGRPTDASGTSVTHPNLPREVVPGCTVLIDDGSIELRVVAVEGDAVDCRVVRGGTLVGSRGVHVRGSSLSLDLLSPDNLADLRFAARQDVDYLAASFVRSAEDVKRIREVLEREGAAIPILAKIECAEAVENLLGIIEAADGTLVARGDLGVAIPVGEVPLVQKRIIRSTVTAGKPVVTATQMLDSMERNDQPTRAEASDVANAILDGTSAVMLSGETARGLHPVEAVRTMADLARRAERCLDEYGDLQQSLPGPSAEVTEAVAQGAVALARHLDAAAILTLTESGSTARAISKYRPACPNLAVASSLRVVRRLALNWGVTPILYDASPDGDDARIVYAIDRARSYGWVAAGDVIVATAGISREAGSTNLVRVVRVA